MSKQFNAGLFLFKAGANSRIVVRATDLAAITDAPMEIELLPVGTWSGYRDRTTGEAIQIEVTMDDLLVAVEYRKQQIQRYPDRDLVIDYEHQTLMDVQAPAAGWMSEFFIRNDSLWAKIKYWTPTAAQYLKNKEYRYFSPVFAFNDVDKETGETIRLMIKNGALTNEPFIDKLQPVVAKDNKEVPIYFLNNKPFTTKGDLTMPTVQEILTYLAALLGLDASSTWDVIKSKLDSLKSGAGEVAAKFKSALKELGLKEDATIDEVKAFAAKYKAILDALEVKATATIDEIKTVIAAKGTAHQPDLKGYVLKSDFDLINGQLKDIQIESVIAKHRNRGALHTKEIDKIMKEHREGRYTMKEIDDNLALRPDFSIVPLQEIQAKEQSSNPDAQPSVEQIKEYAAKNKLSFRDAAIAMTKKK